MYQGKMKEFIMGAYGIWYIVHIVHESILYDK